VSFALISPGESDWRPAPAVRIPRPYQVEAVAAVVAKLRAEQSTMLVLATGLGKTFAAAEVVKALPGRWLFLAHMDQLVHQAKASLERDTGEMWELEQAEFRASANSGRNVVASVQSIARQDRLTRFAPDAFTGIIADEAHHYNSKFFSAPFRYFARSKRLFITATPDRKDGRGYRGLCDSVAYRKELDSAIDEAWATPLDVRTYQSGVDISNVRWDHGDFQAGALDEEIVKAVAPIREAALTLCSDLRTVIFTPGVKSAHTVADAINEIRPGAAMAVDGSMEKDLRREILRDFKAGKFQFIANCMVLTEGWDDEEVRCMIDAAPTSSRARTVQKLGRVTRLWPGVGEIHDTHARRLALAASLKPLARIIDLAFNSKKHEICGPVDVLGGKYSEKERKRAKKILAKEGGDPSEILKRAREELARKAMRAAAAAAAKAKLQESKQPEKRTGAGELALTPGQEKRLRAYGIPFSGETSKREASKLIGFEELCRKNGWCGHREREFLTTWVGLRKDIRIVPYEAGKRLTEMWKAGGKSALSREQIWSVIGTARNKEKEQT
jgi:superfamily II DNA or RNA helicase